MKIVNSSNPKSTDKLPHRVIFWVIAEILMSVDQGRCMRKVTRLRGAEIKE